MTQIFRAALFILLCGISYGAGLVATSNTAHAQTLKAGDACAPNGTTAVSANVDGHINLLYCKSGSWVASSLIAGASLDTCNTAAAGVIKWNGAAMKYCNGTDWADFAAGDAQALSCGQAGGSVSISAPPSVNLCSTGTSTAVATNATNHTWRCNHNNLTADCSALRLVCGATHNGTPVKTPPTNNLCVNGTASAITTNGATQTYNWNCDNTGLSVNCMILNGDVGPTIVATGATKTSIGNYDIYSFSGNGTFKVNALGLDPVEGDRIEYLLVGGGGGGGGGAWTNYGGAGGGGGGMLSGTRQVSAVSYTISVGVGGLGGLSTNTNVATNADRVGSNGANSSIADGGGFEVVAIGGGGGHAPKFPSNGKNGGSGGGASMFLDGSNVQSFLPGQGTAGQGYAGGNPFENNASGTSGGGGGAGGVGQDGVNGKAGDGGVGRVSSITGSAVYYGGGGGGARGRGTSGVGGNGGGGAGNGGGTTAGVNGTGGGGGGDYEYGGTRGGTGGKGIVIIKVRKP